MLHSSCLYCGGEAALVREREGRVTKESGAADLLPSEDHRAPLRFCWTVSHVASDVEISEKVLAGGGITKPRWNPG